MKVPQGNALLLLFSQLLLILKATFQQDGGYHHLFYLVTFFLNVSLPFSLLLFSKISETISLSVCLCLPVCLSELHTWL